MPDTLTPAASDQLLVPRKRCALPLLGVLVSGIAADKVRDRKFVASLAANLTTGEASGDMTTSRLSFVNVAEKTAEQTSAVAVQTAFDTYFDFSVFMNAGII
jgi:hypothetical protein